MAVAPNPVVVQITRGDLCESFHRGSFAIVNAAGTLIAGSGDIAAPVFPRSAIKAFQCLALLDAGGQHHFDLTEAEIAVMCSSHSGEREHVEIVLSLLTRLGLQPGDLLCGAHWPLASHAQYDLARVPEEPQAIHNNCSGKHAGMLALAKRLGAPADSYVNIDHAVQRRIAEMIGSLCDINLANQPHGIDGCSVPTWAVPLRNMALGFARFTDANNSNARMILRSVKAHPFLIAGSKRFDTELMLAVPRAFIKTGAEGVYGACVPHAGLGIALKIDDGASRASQRAIAGILAQLDVWTEDEASLLREFSSRTLRNCAELDVGSEECTIRFADL